MASQSSCTVCPTVTARPGQKTHRGLALVGKGDLHGLQQSSGMHLAHTQAHHAAVQHAAAIVLEELGALGGIDRRLGCRMG